MTSHYDALVIGCGPAGERATIQAARAGKRVAVIERAHVMGGNRVNWGTIPSKTLRESALFVLGLTRNRIHGIRATIGPEISITDFMFRERQVVQRELELINESLDKYQIEVLSGHARLLDPHTVGVFQPDGTGRHFGADVILIATGSSPHRPRDVPFDGETVLDSETILCLTRMPRSMIVLGAGVIGIEYASIFAALGLEVTLVDTRDRLLPFLDREIVGILERELGRLGIRILHDDRYASIERLETRASGQPAAPRVRCKTQQGRLLEAEVLLYCAGRDGNTRDLGLETVGITPNAYGLLEVNAHYQTRHPHLYAAGDVIGYPALASTSMEQGRRAMRHAFAIPGLAADTDVLPFAIYSIPEVSYIGETEEALQSKGLAYLAGRGRYELNPRGQISGDTEGLLKLLFEADSLRLIGAHMVGTGASELIHVGEAFLRSGATAPLIAETLFNYPTFSDLYRHAALKALAQAKDRGSGGSPG